MLSKIATARSKWPRTWEGDARPGPGILGLFHSLPVTLPACKIGT